LECKSTAPYNFISSPPLSGLGLAYSTNRTASRRSRLDDYQVLQSYILSWSVHPFEVPGSPLHNAPPDAPQSRGADSHAPYTPERFLDRLFLLGFSPVSA
jgi:hypothetical protein